MYLLVHSGNIAVFLVHHLIFFSVNAKIVMEFRIKLYDFMPIKGTVQVLLVLNGIAFSFQSPFEFHLISTLKMTTHGSGIDLTTYLTFMVKLFIRDVDSR